MKSIKKDIVRAVTIIPAIILFTLFIAIDIVLDDWVNDKFDQTLITKSNYLKTLVSVDLDGVEFDFADEFMPEFSRKKDAEYFQLWVDKKQFEKSNSLSLYPEEQLANQPLTLNSSKVINIVLPDGRSGKSVMTYFHPQVPTRLREEIPDYQHTAYLSVAISDEEFSIALIALDIIFWLLFFTLIIGLRYLVIVQIDKGLKPLLLLNKEIANLKVDKSSSSLRVIKDEHIEIAPLRAELLRYIEFSQQTLQEEQRLSADIAHELKTPIAEIISLSDLHIKYPNDHRISDTYPQDMLSIAQRMKHIVHNLMMLNQTDGSLLEQKNADIKLYSEIHHVISNVTGNNEELINRVKVESLLENSMVNIDVISFDIILSNLINNALFHSPTKSIVNIKLEQSVKETVYIIIQNRVINTITKEQLNSLFKPLYQIDSARSDESHYGLGLAIVEKLCLINNYKVTVTLIKPDIIEFRLVLNKLNLPSA